MSRNDLHTIPVIRTNSSRYVHRSYMWIMSIDLFEDQGVKATSFSFSSSAASHSHVAEGDDPMLLADLPNDTPYSTDCYKLTLHPLRRSPTGASPHHRQIDSEESGFALHHIVDDDGCSDISIPLSRSNQIWSMRIVCATAGMIL